MRYIESENGSRRRLGLPLVGQWQIDDVTFHEYFSRHYVLFLGNSRISDNHITHLNVADGMPKLSRLIKRTVDLAPGEVTSVNWGGLTSLDTLIATCHFTYTGKAADNQGAIIVEDSVNGRGALSLPAQLVQL